MIGHVKKKKEFFCYSVDKTRNIGNEIRWWQDQRAREGCDKVGGMSCGSGTLHSDPLGFKSPVQWCVL